MTIHTVIIEAISHKYEKFAILTEDKWFNTKAEYAAEWPEKPSVGDTITFDDGGKKYLGKMKIVKKGAGTAPAPAGKSGGYSNIGVEIGHASNLAMRMMEQHMDEGAGFEIGSKEYYKLFISETETIYKLMKGLRSKMSELTLNKAAVAALVDDPVDPVPVPETPKTHKVSDEDVDMSDLF